MELPSLNLKYRVSSAISPSRTRLKPETGSGDIPALEPPTPVAWLQTFSNLSLLIEPHTIIR